MSVGPDDCVYVVECDSDRVSVFDENGKYIKSFGKTGVLLLCLYLLTSVMNF